ncbi:unnamed protein product [Staurois parvus]|uniref:NTF2 domain-containing protein n=1 Tax=Staurois parvus TaxID=386267 RepID=A0ABN9ELE1_9NEOB|nr:unnamed protein product [Staurois parvus]
MTSGFGNSLVQHYYRLCDSDRTHLKSIRTDASCVTWEGQQCQGKDAIIEQRSMLPFQKAQHSIPSPDHQPDNCIISVVVGQLRAEDDPVSGFHHMFVPRNVPNVWVHTNQRRP